MFEIAHFHRDSMICYLFGNTIFTIFTFITRLNDKILAVNISSITETLLPTLISVQFNKQIFRIADTLAQQAFTSDVPFAMS